jgi:tetratricopeptide (TPR) repeat protein
MLGRHDEAMATLEHAVEIHRVAGDLDSMARTLAETWLLHAEAGTAEEGARRFQTVVDLILALHTGDWSQADADLSQAVAVFRQLGAVRQILSTLIVLGRLCLARDDWDMAVQHLEEAEELARRSRDFGGRREAACLHADRDLQKGRAASAYARLTPLLDRPGLQEVSVNPLLVCLAWATVELDEPQEAAQLVTQAVKRLRTDNFRLTLADALRVQALVALRQGQWAAVEGSLEEGLALARAMSYPYGEGRLQEVAG